MSKGLTIADVFELGKLASKPKKRKTKRNATPSITASKLELKCRTDSFGNGSEITTTPSFGTFQVSEGTGEDQRVGKRIYLHSMQIKISLFAGTTTTQAFVGFYIVQDRKPSGAYPAFTDIFTSNGAGQLLNFTNSTRFRLLRRYEKCVTGNITTPATGNEVQYFEDYIPLGFYTTYDLTTSGVIANIKENAIYTIHVSNCVTGATAPRMTVLASPFGGTSAARLRFYDA